MKKLDRY